MRMRSPRIAPPVKGEEGSTATIPTVCPRCLHACARRWASVDLPAPGGPVRPTTRARPVRGKSDPNSAAEPPSFSTAVIARPIARGCRARTPSMRVEVCGLEGASADRIRELSARRREGVFGVRCLVLGLSCRAPTTESRIPAQHISHDSSGTRQEASGDDELLDLRRALADRTELDVPVELLHGEVLDESVAAVD